MAFFELRQYEVRPGKMKDWVALMHKEILPFQVSHGMVICGSYQGEEDESVYVWIRRFDNEAQREQQYEAVYKSDHWQNDILPQVEKLINRETINVQRLVATEMSTMQ